MIFTEPYRPREWEPTYSLDKQVAEAPRHLSRAQAQEARELAWKLCKLLCSPSNATEAAAAYKRTIDMIDEREMP